MRKAVQFAVVLAALLITSIGAKADGSNSNVQYTLTAPGLTMSFTLPADPTIISSANGQDFTVKASNVTLDGKSLGTYTLEFLNASQGGGFEFTLLGVTFDFAGAQLYTNPEGSPAMSTGNFSLGIAGVDHLVASAPEPATLLLLGSGLLGFGFFARRKSPNKNQNQ